MQAELLTGKGNGRFLNVKLNVFNGSSHIVASVLKSVKQNGTGTNSDSQRKWRILWLPKRNSWLCFFLNNCAKAFKNRLLKNEWLYSKKIVWMEVSFTRQNATFIFILIFPKAFCILLWVNFSQGRQRLRKFSVPVCENIFKTSFLFLV